MSFSKETPLARYAGTMKASPTANAFGVPSAAKRLQTVHIIGAAVEKISIKSTAEKAKPSSGEISHAR